MGEKICEGVNHVRHEEPKGFVFNELLMPVSPLIELCTSAALRDRDGDFAAHGPD